MSQKKVLVPNQKCFIDFKNEPWFVLQCLQSIFLKHPVYTNFEKKSSRKSQTMSIKSKLLNGLKNVIVYVISSKPPLIEQHVRCTKVLNIQSIMLVYHAILPENKLKCFKSKPVFFFQFLAFTRIKCVNASAQKILRNSWSTKYFNGTVVSPTYHIIYRGHAL